MMIQQQQSTAILPIMDESRRRLPVPGFCCSEYYKPPPPRRHQHQPPPPQSIEKDCAAAAADSASDVDDDDDGLCSVIFQYNLLPPSNIHNHNQPIILEFHCREPSCGALLPTETAAAVRVTKKSNHDNDDDDNHNSHDDDDDDDDYYVDPNFFDHGYTLAGKTGFQVWTGTRLMIEALLWKLPSSNNNNNTKNRNSISSSSSDHSPFYYQDCPRLQYWQERLKQQANDDNNNDNGGSLHVLELGAGVGVVGTCLAAATGAHVLLTDLPTLVQHSIAPNLQRNSNSTTITTGNNMNNDTTCHSSTWLQQVSDNNINNNNGTVVVHKIHQGYAATIPLDWRIPVEKQFLLSEHHHQQQQSCLAQVDLILASDCVFLVEMLETLLTTVEAIFQLSRTRKPSLLLCFQRRDSKEGNDSKMFTTVNRVIATVQARKWSIECLAWLAVAGNDDDEDTSEVFLFEIIPTNLYSASNHK